MAQSQQSKEGAHILILDDSLGSAEYLRLALLGGGFRSVAVCHDVAEACRSVAARVPEFVILDLMLDGCPAGLDFYLWLRGRKSCATTYVVFLSGAVEMAAHALRGRDDERTFFLQIGAIDLYDVADLVARVLGRDKTL